MSRYIQHNAENPPAKKDEKPERELKKPGKYTSEELKGTKNRPFKGGGSWRQA